MNGWTLPREARIGGKCYPIYGDFRDILEIIGYLNDPDMPEYLRWEIALALFYEGQIPWEYKQEAMCFLSDFIACGDRETGKNAPKLIDWEQDCQAIVAGVNQVAGTEIRSLPFLHWWTFLSFFNGIGQGQLATIVSIRDKLRRGKKLDPWEQEFYRENKSRVDLRKRYSAAELEEQKRLKELLDGGR